MQMLVKQYKVQPDIPNSEGYTALCLAVQRGHRAIVEWLIQQGADKEHRTPLGWSLLHIAAW